MAQQKIVIDLFYDILSPYSWIVFEALTRYHKKFSFLDVRLRPVSLSNIMMGTGNKPPGLVIAKSKYMNKDLARLSKYFDLPLRMPKDIANVLFRKGSLKAQHLLTFVAKRFPEKLEDLSRELSLRVWSRDEDVAALESLKKACQTVGFSQADTNMLLEGIEREDVKAGLKDTTKLAMDYNAFGVPTYVAHLADGPEVFFGSDRLFMLAHFLKIPFPGALNEFKSSKL